MTTKIFRIENEDGEGMYYAYGTNILDCETYFDRESLHPFPYMDSLLIKSLGDDNVENIGIRGVYMPLERFHYAFSTVEQLRRWLCFDEWLLFLHNHGFSLYEIDATEAYTGHTQAVYIKNVSDKQQKHNIKEFFKLS